MNPSMMPRFKSLFISLSLFASANAWASPEPCDYPEMNHAIILFGDGDASTYDYRSANHTFGNAGSDYVKGIAVDGNVQFPNFSVSVRSTGIVSDATTPDHKRAIVLARFAAPRLALPFPSLALPSCFWVCPMVSFSGR